LGTEIFVEIRGQRVKAVVVGTPFYKRSRTPRAQPGVPVPR
jgi:glycine cleavage system aminomethyltransferase T